jgi:hypothetical protein
MQKYKILFILYYFPPLHSIAVKRNYFLSTFLSKKFNKSKVISSFNTLNLTTDYSFTSRIADILLPVYDYRNRYGFQSKNTNNHYTENSKNNFFGRFAIKLINTFPFNILLGEGGYHYIRKAYKSSIVLIEKENFTHIYTSFRPFSDHFIGFLLKSRFKEKIVWIADFRDLPIDPIYKNVLFPWIQHKIIKKIMSNADYVTTVSDGLANQIQNIYGKNVLVIRNGIEELVENNETLYEKFTLTYTGSLYTNERNPSPIFEAIFNLIDNKILEGNDVNICYAGKDTELWNTYIVKYGLENLAINNGMLNSIESILLQKKSHINILLTSASIESQGVITGKFYEYVAAQRPILVSINGVDDMELSSIIMKKNLGIVTNSSDTNQVKSIENWIEVKYLEYKKNSKMGNLTVNLDEFLWENQVKQLEKKLFEQD